MNDTHMTGWPYEDDDLDDVQRVLDQEAQRHYLDLRDEAVRQALVLLNRAALDSPKFSLEDITRALLTVVEEFNRAAGADIDIYTIIKEL